MARSGHRYRCNKCKDTGVVPPNPEIKLCPNCTPDIDQSCERLVQWIRSLDPTYAMRLDGMMQERRVDAKQACGRMFSYVLRNSLQNETTDDPLFADGAEPTPERVQCGECGTTFKARWPGDKYCKPLCTEAARQKGLVPPSQIARPPVPIAPPEAEVEAEAGVVEEEPFQVQAPADIAEWEDV
jgi:hypothetical protein